METGKKTPYQKGMQAFKEGKFENPYNEDNEKGWYPYREWQRGWNEAYYQNLNHLNGHDMGTEAAGRSSKVH